jgi:beta-glucosidase-like glycosyl hydrolase
LASGEPEGNEGRALGVDLIYGPQVDLARHRNVYVGAASRDIRLHGSVLVDKEHEFDR